MVESTTVSSQATISYHGICVRFFACPSWGLNNLGWLVVWLAGWLVGWLVGNAPHKIP